MEPIIKLFLLLFVGVLVSGQELRWQNSYDQPLHFNCPVQQSISTIRSQHNNKHEDRQWDFECKTTFSSNPTCIVSSYVNDFDQEFTFECPQNYVMTGMESYHENRHEDRRWKFTCCTVNNFCTSDCQWGNYVNYFDEPFSYQVPHNLFLAGVDSYHDNKHEDRRWQYRHCAKTSYC